MNDKTHKRATSNPGDGIPVLIEERSKKSAFPKLYDYCGYLDIRTRATKSWKRKYFVLANNFLLMGTTPYSEKLEKVIPLEGSNVKTTIKTSNLSFEILIRKKRNQFRAPNESECNMWTERIHRASKLKIKDIYRFDAILGSNATGTTKVLSAKHRVTGEEVAVKVISKKEYNPKMLSNEVLILKRLDHPNVVKLFDLFETKKSVYLVMEKCVGGELFEQIANLDGGGFSEKECIMVLHQISRAVKYMHSMGIVHRDLKPENILCVKPGSIQQIKLADFGISKVIFDPEIRKKEKLAYKKQQKLLAKEKKKNKNKHHALRTLKQRTKEMYQQQYSMNISLGHSNSCDDEKELLSAPNNNDKTTKSAPSTPNGTHTRKNNKKNRRKSKKNVIDPLAKKNRKKPSNQHHRHGNKQQHRHKHRMSSTYWDAKKYELMTTMCGTISYTAPEILKEKPYDKRVDYWSLGVIAFILLCGYPPFWGDTELDVANNILSSGIILDSEDWKHVSDNGKKLVLGLLERNPSKRLGVDDILKHTWILASKSISKKARKSLMKTVAKRRIRKMSMGVFEKNSKRMDYIYRNHMNKKKKDNDSSPPHTPSASSLTRETSNSISRSYSQSQSQYDSPMDFSRNSISFTDTFRRYSKTDEDLFELRLPSQISITPRSSNILNGDVDDPFGQNDDGNSWNFDNINHQRKWSR